jgi:POT family proton-dependent oligopeptide transporter
MLSDPAPQPAPTANRWPQQIKYIVGNEACERFSYYGMRSILAGYITGKVVSGGLGHTDDFATEVIHTFVFVNYFLPLLGAWLSDKIIGRYHTILWVSLFYCAGHGVLACSDLATTVSGKTMFLYTGLSLIAFGSGGIKPCVSAFMGDQFKPEQSHLLQKAYGAFYWAINFGSFFAFLVVPWVKDHRGYSAAFAVPGILMAIATFIFWLGRNQYVRVPPTRVSRQAGFFPVLFAALANDQDKGKGFWDRARGSFSDAEVDAAKSVLPILMIFALIPIFFSLFDQTNSTWVLQGEKMAPFHLLGFKIGAEEMQSANPAIVMILVPLFTLGFYPRMGRLASPLNRMTLGMFLAAGSYAVVAALQSGLEQGRELSVLWQLVPYFILTSAEVLVSTTGLEFAFREAAPEMKSTVMSFWLLAIAFGDLFVAVLTKLLSNGSGDASVSTTRFLQYAGLTLIVAIIFRVVAGRYNYRDRAAAAGR